jgi:8-oxo-dGTP pyrophosphatase MutT (NUDIX family)
MRPAPDADWRVHTIAADAVLRIGREQEALPPALERAVALLWQTARARNAALFNGRVFSADTVAPHLLTGHMAEFRRMLAQIARPDLGAALQLRPVAVVGVLLCPDGVVIGQRDSAAVYQPGFWQTPPAGSVDAGALRPDGTLDPQRQLLAELQEELGVPASAVENLAPICMVEHPGSRVLDIVYRIALSWSAGAVLEAHRRHGNGEYARLDVLEHRTLSAAAAALGTQLTPPARLFLSRLHATEPHNCRL